MYYYSKRYSLRISCVVFQLIKSNIIDCFFKKKRYRVFFLLIRHATRSKFHQYFSCDVTLSSKDSKDANHFATFFGNGIWWIKSCAPFPAHIVASIFIFFGETKVQLCFWKVLARIKISKNNPLISEHSLNTL